MKSLEDELIAHFGERLLSMTSEDAVPAGIGSPLGKVVERDSTIVFCRLSANALMSLGSVASHCQADFKPCRVATIEES